jgi:hypothetical protein
MRKVLVVLLLTFIVLPLAFADSLTEAHRIAIRTTVAQVKPVFQFEFTAGMEDPDTVTSVTAGEQGVDAEATKPPVVFVSDIKVNDLNLIFTAKLANEAKCFGSYTLTFIAGNFDVVRDGVSGVLSPTSVEVNVADDFNSRVGVDSDGIQANSLQLSFNGNRCTTGNLATFEVKYEADSELDPATYYTDISLEVSSNN